MKLWRSGSFQDDPVVIEALRGLAAMIVVISHADTWYMIRTPLVMDYKLYLGDFGVQLFFILSGYLIWQSLGRLLPMPGGWRQYLIRRVTRIAPLYYGSLAIILLISPYVKWSFDADHSFDNVALHLVFAQSLSLTAAHTINPVVWTLTYEVIFYIAAPLLWSFRRHISWIFVASIILCVVGWMTKPPVVGGALIVMPSFLVGSLFAEKKALPNAFSMLAAVAIACVCGLLAAPEFVSTVFWAVAVFAAAALLVAHGLGSTLPIKALAPIGVVSYSLYIWHYVLLDIVGPWWWSYPWLHVHTFWHGTMYIGLSLFIAAASYFLIERPGMTMLRDALLARFAVALPAGTALAPSLTK
jgi:exopolysaccharide production protein ExoZ